MREEKIVNGTFNVIFCIYSSLINFIGNFLYRREVGRDEQRGYSRREGGGEQRNRREERQPEQRYKFLMS